MPRYIQQRMRAKAPRDIHPSTSTTRAVARAPSDHARFSVHLHAPTGYTAISLGLSAELDRFDQAATPGPEVYLVYAAHQE